MITPRRTRLVRVPDLAAFRTTLSEWILALPHDRARETCVIVPTSAAAEQLRRTVEDDGFRAGRTAVIWPVLTTRRELYTELWARLPRRPRQLSPFEREVLLAAACRAATGLGRVAPYAVGPALVAEMLALYDEIRRLGRTVADFERNFVTALDQEQDTDRGAARLLQQTEFLAAAYREYETRVRAAGRADEHVLRDALLQGAGPRPMRRVVVSVADRVADPGGMWPADFDMLARLPGLEELELVCTERVLGSGYLERLYAAFPDLQEDRFAGVTRPVPVMVVPSPHATTEDSPCFSYRDREEELAAVARRLKHDRATRRAAPLHRTALVVRRPLPYLYLARQVLADAGVPFEALDTLPLAAEPYAAAVDLVVEAVSADFTRSSLLALLRSPHFDLGIDSSVAGAAIDACDFALADARYLGDLDRLEALVDSWSAAESHASRDARRRRTALLALTPLLVALRTLRPLCVAGRLSEHGATLLQWLRRFDRPAPATGDARRARVRAAVLGAIASLTDAYTRHDPDATGDVADLAAALRRWLGAQTFALQSGEPGLQIVDAQAARYADVDDVQIVGLIQGEWPERWRRNVLYPPALLALLEPLPAIADPGQWDREALRSARAQFHDLLLSPATHVRLSTFALEHDAVVEPSSLLDEISAIALTTKSVEAVCGRVSCSEALALEPRRPDVLPDPASAWAAVRVGPDSRVPARLRGEAGPWRLPRVSISRLEQYLNCPFKFFAAQVLGLEERPEDAPIQTPLERGRFLHDLWERFFHEWQRRGHGRIDPDHVADARVLFTEIGEQALATLPPAEAALERQRLLGSAVDPGIAHRVFTLEASRPTPIVERLLEFALEGEFVLRPREGLSRRVAIKAKADRIDVLANGAIRVIDYKSKHTPDPRVALQLPIYARLAREVLERTEGRSFALAEAVYVSFEGNRAVVPLRPSKGQTLDDVVAEAEERALQALDRIGAGQFQPRPLKKSLCAPCAYRAVCRLETVAASPEADGE